MGALAGQAPVVAQMVEAGMCLAWEIGVILEGLTKLALSRMLGNPTEAAI